MGCVYSNARLRDYEDHPPRHRPSKQAIKSGVAESTHMFNRYPANANTTTYSLTLESLKDEKMGKTAVRGKGPGPDPEPHWRTWPRGHERRNGRVTCSDDTIYEPARVTPVLLRDNSRAKRRAAALAAAPTKKPTTPAANKKQPAAGPPKTPVTHATTKKQPAAKKTPRGSHAS
jgi:hypothetical protein